MFCFDLSGRSILNKRKNRQKKDNKKPGPEKDNGLVAVLRLLGVGSVKEGKVKKKIEGRGN